MPEGDTIFRTATNLRKWMEGRQVTAAETKVLGLPIARVVGQTVEEVTPKAKHLLIRFSNGLTLHTHMRMTGSWHLYRAGEKWKKPYWQARVILTCDDRVAVCFNAPVVEMLTANDEQRHASLSGLGPDVLGQLDLDEVRRRAATRPPEYSLGELLLDQQVVSGIGNIYRCEALFLERLSPWTRRDWLDDAALDQLVMTATRLMKANIGPAGNRGRDFDGGGPNRPWVYGRTNRPCRRCGTPISGGRIGKQARDVYWCPKCQPMPEK